MNNDLIINKWEIPEENEEILQEIFARAYIYRNRVQETLCQIYLRINSIWYSIVIDAGDVFGRKENEPPVSFEEGNGEFAYPVFKTKEMKLLENQKIKNIEMKRSGGIVLIVISFNNGVNATIQEDNDTCKLFISGKNIKYKEET